MSNACHLTRVLIAMLFGAFCVGNVNADASVEPRPQWPDTILIAPALRPHIDQMLQRSQTFRQQFERVASAPRLIVSVRFDPTLPRRPFCARSLISRYDSGLLMVRMDIGTCPSPAEWIAHEFEHVLEQLDGVRLSPLAVRRSADAWFSGDEMVETRRAMRAGRQVGGEMRRPKRRSDKFVE